MAAIDPDQTQPVTPAKAAAAAVAANGGRRRARPEPAAVAPAPDQVAPVLDAATLTSLLRGLGYGADQQGPNTVAHAADEGSLIQLVDTGVVRFPAPLPVPEGKPKVYRLRPPLFGEHKRIRGALAEALTAIDEATIVYAEATVEANAAKAAAATMDQPERARAMHAAKQAQRAADAAADEAVEAHMAPWWQLVFETLGIEGVPDEFGPWLLDHNLAADIVNHWRTSPRAPGR